MFERRRSHLDGKKNKKRQKVDQASTKRLLYRGEPGVKAEDRRCGDKGINGGRFAMMC